MTHHRDTNWKIRFYRKTTFWIAATVLASCNRTVADPASSKPSDYVLECTRSVDGRPVNEQFHVNLSKRIFETRASANEPFVRFCSILAQGERCSITISDNVIRAHAAYPNGAFIDDSINRHTGAYTFSTELTYYGGECQLPSEEAKKAKLF